MNYSDDPAMVRVDFFKASGKWYTTEAVKWTGGYHGISLHDSFNKSLREHFKESPKRLSEMDAVCLEPYHENAHPLCIRSGRWIYDE